MRVSIQNQLSILLVLSSSIGLATLAIATWCANHSYVLKVARDGLETAASLKAVEVAISLDLMYTACLYLTTNGPLQHALKRYNNASDTSLDNWKVAAADMASALNSLGSLRHTLAVQSQLRPGNTSGPFGHRSVLNVTGAGNDNTLLPFIGNHGAPIYLGQGDLGYPPSLYPNLTISKIQGDVLAGSYLAKYKDEALGLGSNLVLGPLTISDKYALMSMTVPVVDNYSEFNILGWLTVVQDARLIVRILDDYTGLGQTGQTVLFGPVNANNRFPPGAVASQQRDVRFVLPVRPSATSSCPSCTSQTSLLVSAYPAIESAISDGFRGSAELGSMLATHNEEGNEVSVAYCTPPTKLVDWIVVIEQSTSEFWAPVNQLRTIILACLFSVLGFFFFASLPIAHWAVRPIKRLKAATLSTIDPLYRSINGSSRSFDPASAEPDVPVDSTSTRKNSLLALLLRCWQRDRTVQIIDGRDKRFRIPTKVDTSKHWVKDDISDLMETFNDMSDELFLQYDKLDERVRQRTIELEQSKKAAEAANESKTMFVANVSHELKTPLNGILGMCATSIEDDDVQQMKTSLSIIYNSGDLLLRTLNDLLMFSTNQIGSRELILDEREFTLHDLEAQILTIFGKTAMDKGIILRFKCEETSPGPYSASLGLMNMTLWGDVHRILQIIINLVSNSIKYTPNDGQVSFVVRRSLDPAPRRLPHALEQSSFQSQRTQMTRSSLAPKSVHGGTANFISPTEGYQLQERSAAPPGNDLYVEFEVRDTGQGISEELQSRIFEPFVQGEVGLNRRHSGTGLGLSICSQLAALMKGSIALESTVGLGTTFTVKIPLRHVMTTPSRSSINPSVHVAGTSSGLSSWTDTDKGNEKLPEKDAHDEPKLAQTRSEDGFTRPESKDQGISPALNSEHEPSGNDTQATPRPSISQEQATASSELTKKARKGPKEVPNAEKCDFSKLRVLVAEDNKVNQQVILRMLKMEQILQVTIAEDGQQALELVKAQLSKPEDHCPFDLVFMDIQMPNMDGITSTRLMRESGFQTPIVALTAYAEQTNINDCYQSGMNNFLAKPLQRPQLRDVLIRL